MKVLILAVIMMLPNGTPTSTITQVKECPTSAEIMVTINDLKAKGVITDAVVSCKLVEIWRDA